MPQEKIFSQDGKLIYAPDGIEGSLYKFGKIEPGEIKDGMISFSAWKTEQVIVRGKNSPEKSISAEAVKNLVMDIRNKAAENIRNTMNSQGR